MQYIYNDRVNYSDRLGSYTIEKDPEFKNDFYVNFVISEVNLLTTLYGKESTKSCGMHMKPQKNSDYTRMVNNTQCIRKAYLVLPKNKSLSEIEKELESEMNKLKLSNEYFLPQIILFHKAK